MHPLAQPGGNSRWTGNLPTEKKQTRREKFDMKKDNSKSEQGDGGENQKREKRGKYKKEEGDVRPEEMIVKGARDRRVAGHRMWQTKLGSAANSLGKEGQTKKSRSDKGAYKVKKDPGSGRDGKWKKKKLHESGGGVRRKATLLLGNTEEKGFGWVCGTRSSPGGHRNGRAQKIKG